MIRIKFKNIDQVAHIYNYIEGSIFDTGNLYLDNLINSIIQDLALKLYNKYQKDSIRPWSLKQHEALALITFYNHIPVKADPFQAATLIEKFTFIHQKISK